MDAERVTVFSSGTSPWRSTGKPVMGDGGGGGEEGVLPLPSSITRRASSQPDGGVNHCGDELRANVPAFDVESSVVLYHVALTYPAPEIYQNQYLHSFFRDNRQKGSFRSMIVWPVFP